MQVSQTRPTNVLATIDTLRAPSNDLRLAPAGMSKLSADIIIEIFLSLVVACRGDMLQHPKPYMWLVVTEVCHFWRSAALACPRLWNYIGLYDPRVIDRLVYLSKSVPPVAKVGLRLGRRPPNDRVAKVLSLLPRFHQLDVTSDNIREMQPFLSQDPQKVVVQKLSFSLIRRGTGRDMLKGPFVEVNIPSLQVLRLRGCCISWNSPIFTGLVELVLENLKYELTVSELRNVLLLAPHIKYLSLLNAGPRFIGDDDGSRIVLHSLENLVFRGSRDLLEALFRLIEIPRATHTPISFITGIEGNRVPLHACLIPLGMSGTMFESGLHKVQTMATVAKQSGQYMYIYPEPATTSMCNQWMNSPRATVTRLELILKSETKMGQVCGGAWVALLAALPALQVLCVDVTEVRERQGAAASAFALVALLRILGDPAPAAVHAGDPFYSGPFRGMERLSVCMQGQAMSSLPGPEYMQLVELDFETREQVSPVAASDDVLNLWVPLLALAKGRNAVGKRLRRMRFKGLADDGVQELGKFVDEVVGH